MFKKIGSVCCLSLFTCSAFAQTVHITAAPSLAHVLNESIKLYQQEYKGTQFNLNLIDPLILDQSPTNIPTDIYISMDKEQLKAMTQNKVLSPSYVKYLATNQLVAITAADKDVPFGQSEQFNFAQAFKGNLCTAPFKSTALGTYTFQSLQNLGWFNPLQSRIVQRTDANDILAAVQKGTCEVGIVYQTDALTTNKVKMMGSFSEHTHSPIHYYVNLSIQGRKNKSADQFEEFLVSNTKVKALLKNYGFTTKK